MYSTIESLKKKIDVRLLIQYVNDENVLEEEVDLESEADARVIRIKQVSSEVKDEIDNYLRGRYTLPLASVPSTIQTISDDRVIYNLKKRRHRDEMSESEQKIYNDSTKQLQSIQRGEILLDLEKVSATDNSGNGQIYTNKTASDKMFNDDLLMRF